jgi:small subunit ribosomal protein S3
VAISIADQLERRLPFRRVLKQSLNRIMQANVKGARIMVKGRLNGNEISRTEWVGEGMLPLHTLRVAISYGEATAYTTYGTIGVKVWLYAGDDERE